MANSVSVVTAMDHMVLNLIVIPIALVIATKTVAGGGEMLSTKSDQVSL